MSTEASDGRAVKLPVFRTLSDSLGALRPIAGMALAQIAIMALVIACGGLLVRFLVAAGSAAPAPELEKLTDSLDTIFGGLAGWFLSINYTLGISRWVLFGQRPTLMGLFRWGSRQWRLLGVELLCALLLGAAIGLPLIGVVGILYRLPSPIMAIPPLALVIFALWLSAGLWLTTPVVASDDPASAIHRAWALSRGQRFRLAGLALLLAVPVLVAGALLNFLSVVVPSEAAGFFLAAIVTALIAYVTSYALTALLTAAATVAFARLAGLRSSPVEDAPATQPA